MIDNYWRAASEGVHLGQLHPPPHDMLVGWEWGYIWGLLYPTLIRLLNGDFEPTPYHPPADQLCGGGGVLAHGLLPLTPLL